MNEWFERILIPAHSGELKVALAACNELLVDELDSRERAEVLLLMGICKMAMLDNSHAEVALNSALEVYDSLDDGEMIAYCRVQLMRPALDTRAAASIKEQLVEIIATAEQQGWDGVLSQACWVLSRVRLEEKKDSLADEAIIRSQGLDDPFRLQWERIVRNVYLVCGRLLRDTEISENGLLRILGTLEPYRLIPRVNIYFCSEMSRCCYLSGDLPGSAEMMYQLLDYLDECPESWGSKWWMKAVWHYNLGHNFCAQGSLGKARQAFSVALTTARERGYLNMIPMLKTGEGFLALKTGRPADAVITYQAALDEAETIGANLPFYIEHYLGIALLACGRREEASGHWDRKQSFQVTPETMKTLDELQGLLQAIGKGRYPETTPPDSSCRQLAEAWLGELEKLRANKRR